MGVLDKRIYKRIEWHLYNYHNLKREIEQEKQEIIEKSGRDIAEWGGGISFRSDPTASKGIKLTNPELVKKEKWLKVIEKTIQHFQGTEKGRLLQKKYLDLLGERHICRELHIERTTYYRWREEIITYVALLATQHGLIKF